MMVAADAAAQASPLNSASTVTALKRRGDPTVANGLGFVLPSRSLQLRARSCWTLTRSSGTILQLLTSSWRRPTSTVSRDRSRSADF